MAETKRQPPCLEEYVARGYKAENYEAHFPPEDGWLPTWSNPRWVKPPREVDMPEGIPAALMVCSQVRKQSSRLLRKQQPGRQKFKQFLFSDPSKRLLRARPLRITSTELVTYFDELYAKERAGILAVQTVDGRRLDLGALREGMLAMKGRVPAVSLPTPPLDSIANDTPAGNEMPQFVDGTFVGDPAAERVLANLVEEKTAEGIRQGAISEPTEDPEEAEEAQTTPPAADSEVLESESVPPLPAQPDSKPESVAVSPAMDPAALRAAAKRKARR